MSGSAATNVQLAPGDYTVQSSDIVIGHQTFAPVTRMRTLSILANGNAIVLLYAYYLARAAYIVQLQTSIFSDLYGHRTFVNMFTSALLQLVWTWNAANTLALIQMSGPSPFITVSGTRNADGSATLTGSGSAAGFSSVPATFTGTIGDGTPAGNLRASSDGVSNILAHLAGVSDVINSKYQLGQVNAPTGLPNGPIIYTISGTGAPSIP